MSDNIVLVSIDSLRTDHCGFHGYGKGVTPTMDSMAEDGLVFENAIAPAPSTPGSMSATHTGRFLKPYSTDGDAVIVNRQHNISRHMRKNPTLAERLSKNGYTTIGFSANPFTSRYFGYGDDFDEYTDFLDSDERPLAGLYDRIFQRFVSGDTELTPVRLMLNYLEGEEIFKSWEEYYDDVLAAVESADEPYFLWVFLLDTHLPYFVNRHRRDGISWPDMWRYNLRLYRSDPQFSDEELEDLIALYDATVRRVDDFLDRLTDDLADSDPVYFVHSDHGEAFGEHGMYGHEPYTYEENIHVPYFIANGDWTGTRSEPVSLRQIPHHIWEHAGLGEWEDSAEQPGSDTLSNPFGMRSAVRTNDWKYIWKPGADESEEVYALSEDPAETENLAGTQSDVTEDLQRLAEFRISSEREQLAISNAIESVTEATEL